MSLDVPSDRFHTLAVTKVRPEAGSSVVLTLSVPQEKHDLFAFEPGQFVTLQASIDGQWVRRNYSICSSRQHYEKTKTFDVGIRVVPQGRFSSWAATQLNVGDVLSVMPPEGRFVSRLPSAKHRVGFAAGSGITPILSILRSTLEDDASSRFTLVYGNRQPSSVMFNEVLQDLKDRDTDRLTLINIWSRQIQEFELLQGHIDEAKVHALMQTLIPSHEVDEVFVCGPSGMIEATVKALVQAGVGTELIRTEWFASPDAKPESPKPWLEGSQSTASTSSGTISLTLIMDGKQHTLRMNPDQTVLEVGLAAGLDLPFSCRGGVCCTCRAKLLHGSVNMAKNFTLEPWETKQGFVLSCQSSPSSEAITLSFDER
jgi:ring-1,2-phenylacetyl-CoA epoxidase subunit PaaE